MKKNEKLNKWLWKWHFIAGIISLPFIVILSITGLIYLFKDDFEASKNKQVKEVVIENTLISYQQQWDIANKNATKKPNSMVVPQDKNHATEFISGRFGGKSSIFINPHNGKVTGKINPKGTFMHKVRKLHGELLMGKWGTKIVELIASWMVVLIITGLYVWWPSRGWSLKGFFIPRTNIDRRTFFRDLHAISGFWISVLLLMTLAGGFPWTDVFGENFKWVQKTTNTGYPTTWEGKQLESKINGQPLTLDQIVEISKKQNLLGEVTIRFPKSSKGVFSIENQLFSNQEAQKMIHLDQYSGKILLTHDWSDVGVLMRGRMWFMAFHQGQFGKWNWWLMAFTAFVLAIMSISAIISYLLRKRKESWGVPKVPSTFKVGYAIIFILALLSVIFPLFGISLVLILSIEYLRKKKKNYQLKT